MFEMIINPKRAERHPWELFIVGFVYASLSIFLVKLVFSGDAVLARYSGIFMVTFTVIFSMPFFYYLIKQEEEKNITYEGSFKVLIEHSKAIFALLWLFLGFIIAFSIWYSVLPSGAENFRAQIETFCYINSPGNYDGCVNDYLTGGVTSQVTGGADTGTRFLSIFVNNVYVMIFTVIFSLIFGAGAIFILAWNASVIAAAIGIFTKGSFGNLGYGLLRYMIHGLPEIAAYFIAALGGGIISIAIIKKDTNSDRFWLIFQDALYLIIIALVVLVIAAIIEVFITPSLF